MKPAAPLTTVAREWTRIGLTGFGGPPSHVVLLRQLMVDRQRVDGRRVSSRTPTQPAGCCPARRRRSWRSSAPTESPGRPARSSAASGFIVPAVVLVLVLSLLFLSQSPPLWVRGAGAGAGAAVAAVAVHAARALIGPSIASVGDDRMRRVRWAIYLAVGAAASALLGAYVVLALARLRRFRARRAARHHRHGARCCCWRRAR